MSSFLGGGGGGGSPGFGSGWTQTMGSPGDTHTTPINAPGGSNQNGPDIDMFAGNGDGAGFGGNIVFKLPTGNQNFDPAGTPSSGVMVLDGTNNFSSTFNIVQPYAAMPNQPQALSISAANGDVNGGFLNFFSGVAQVSGNGGDINFTSGPALAGQGGNINFMGGIGLSGFGGGFTVLGGSGSQGKGGHCRFQSGSSDTDEGGSILFIVGDSSAAGFGSGAINFTSGSNTGGSFSNGGDINFQTGSASGTNPGNGGNIIFNYGTGAVNGHFLPQVPTSDPSVAGAVWSNHSVLFLSGASNYSGTITAATLAAAMTGITVTNGIITAFS